MPPPHPCNCPAKLPTPEAYVPNAPISNSLALKNSGGGGGGAITCLEDTTGSPAKVATACDAMATTAKAINLFIGVVLLMYGSFRWSSAQNLGLAPRHCCGICSAVFRRFFPLVPFFITRALMSSLTPCSVVLHPSADPSFWRCQNRRHVSAVPRFGAPCKAANHICGTVMPRCPWYFPARFA
jgi:hypothetical protein